MRENKNTYAYLIRLIENTAFLLHKKKSSFLYIIENYKLHSFLTDRKYSKGNYSVLVETKNGDNKVKILLKDKEQKYSEVLFIVDDYVTVFIDDLLFLEIGEKELKYYINTDNINNDKEITSKLPKINDFHLFIIDIKDIQSIINNDLVIIINKIFISDFTEYNENIHPLSNVGRLLSGIAPELYPFNGNISRSFGENILAYNDNILLVNDKENLSKFLYVKLKKDNKYIKICVSKTTYYVDFVDKDQIPELNKILNGSPIIFTSWYNELEWVRFFLESLFVNNMRNKIYNASIKFMENV